MPNVRITSNQAIDYLTNLKNQLEHKIFHIDKTITCLSNPSKKESETAKPSDINEADIAHSSTLKPKNHIGLKAEEKFDPNSKLDKKIAYVLSKIGNGFKDDIVAELQTLQPEQDVYKLEQAIAVRLSYLLKIKAIQGRKISRRYEYSLFE